MARRQDDGKDENNNNVNNNGEDDGDGDDDEWDKDVVSEYNSCLKCLRCRLETQEAAKLQLIDDDNDDDDDDERVEWFWSKTPKIKLDRGIEC